ncbi:twin-arginine translocase TatA/TatE family subunit [Telluribacter humicola]
MLCSAFLVIHNLPDTARALGHWVHEFKKATEDIKDALNDAVPY